ncbi:flavin reductase (DIM6/NTAB) family NADH-FMN oxidoreductase RutF [Roseiarcus fermentans]|uniref:Flavin reductase (DIM6/NTAB) family NADH-FMN oxidoreductase RutF n=1 Tax=Roseiarcus fermentans TaxID=1473586 RepID=A0A366F7B9_9HYPH|nr:flavin reductase family protein [Roseiarcus fermentans]RBP09860.1 flavin reductase (DIM6/NTAB) family NADH-FMN oxidoreductase RutF [Roseiarcus fermentans]
MLPTNVRRLHPRPTSAPLHGVDSQGFKDAMRQLASGVCVVTVGAGDERNGLTATSVSSLSDEPPTLLVCVHRAASSYPAFERYGAFAVNVLAADQREIADRFAGATNAGGAGRFAGGRWLELPDGGVCLAESVAVLDCEVEERIERHSHAIVIGRVRRTMIGANSGALVYWRGRYDQIGWTDAEVARAVGLSPRIGAFSPT